MNCLFYNLLFLIMLSTFLNYKKKHNLEVINYLLCCFWPSHQNALFALAWRIVDSEVNTPCYDWFEYEQLCMFDNIYRSNIAGTASSFSFSLSENPVSNCALFVNESVVNEVNKEPSSYWSGEVHPLFPNVGIRKKALQRLFFSLYSDQLFSDPSLSYGF